MIDASECRPSVVSIWGLFTGSGSPADEKSRAHRQRHSRPAPLLAVTGIALLAVLGAFGQPVLGQNTEVCNSNLTINYPDNPGDFPMAGDPPVTNPNVGAIQGQQFLVNLTLENENPVSQDPQQNGLPQTFDDVKFFPSCEDTVPCLFEGTVLDPAVATVRVVRASDEVLPSLTHQENPNDLPYVEGETCPGVDVQFVAGTPPSAPPPLHEQGPEWLEENADTWVFIQEGTGGPGDPGDPQPVVLAPGQSCHVRFLVIVEGFGDGDGIDADGNPTANRNNYTPPPPPNDVLAPPFLGPDLNQSLRQQASQNGECPVPGQPEPLTSGATGTASVILSTPTATSSR